MKIKRFLSLVIALTMLMAMMSYTVSADTNISEVRLTGLTLEDLEYGSAVSVLTSSISVTSPAADSSGNKPIGVSATMQRYENGEWVDYNRSTFIDGLYCVKLNVYSSSSSDVRYAFASKPTVKYNSKACTVASWTTYSAIAYTTDFFNVSSTEYGLEIAETVVTSANADDVLGDGVFSYDAGSQILTVNGNCTYGGAIIYNKSISGLIINVAGDSVLHGSLSGACLELDADTYITGKGKLTLIHDNNSGISAWESAVVEIVNAEIDVTAKTYALYYFNDANGKLKVTDSKLNLHGDKAGLYNFQKGVILSGCIIKTPSSYKVSGGTVYESNGTTMAKDVVIAPEEYNLTIAGVKVTSRNRHNILADTAQGDGGFRYNPSTNTLIISKSIMSSGTVISSQINGLTIELDGNITLAGDTIISTTGVSTTITGGSLYCNSTSNYPISVLYSGTLTIKDTIINGSMTGNGHTATKLVVDNSAVTASKGVVNFGGGITIQNGIRVVTPVNAVVGTSVFENNGTTKATDVFIGEAYDLWVKGSRVKNSNASDILRDGVLKYDAGTKTLTINGDITYYAGYVIESNIDGLKINVEGDSVINAFERGVMLTGDTEITGSGKLTVDASFMSIYVNNGAELTVKDADITVGGKYGLTGNPSGETLKIINSKVNATGSIGAICDFADITVEDCYIVTPKGAQISNGHICESDGTKATTVFIDTVNHDVPITVTSIEGQKAYFRNDLSESVQTKVIFAFYDSNDKLLSVKSVSKTMSPGSNMVNSMMSAPLGSMREKIFVWSPDGNIKPLSYSYDTSR